jgi:hypothetical protein
VTIATRPSNLIAMSGIHVFLPYSPCGRRWRDVQTG